jgi:N-acyl-D-amino-acid deacylase
LRELGRGTIESVMTKAVSILDDEEYEFLDFLLSESTRPVTWLALLNRDDMPDICQETLRRAEPLIRRGGIPQVTCRPLIIEINLRNPFIFANLASWNPVFNQPPEVQEKIYRDESFRNAFRQSLEHPAIFNGKWDRLVVKEVANPAMKPLEGRTVADIARERGKDGVDAFLDLALEDHLAIQYSMALFNATEERIPELISDPRTMIGLSDGGAHVDMLCDAGYCTYLLGTWVRDRQAMTLERAIQRITSEPAGLFGIKNRGRLMPGLAADVAIFDYNTVGSNTRGEMRNDLPGGGRRLVMPARGIEYTVVNGEILYERGKASGALPGQVLRSGNC